MSDCGISIIIPTYNRADLLGRAISSALPQCEKGDEVIVIDDGSTDHTADIVSGFGNSCHYVRVLNRGAGAARNRGIGEARNPLVAFLDSDDEWMPNKLALQRIIMRAHPEILFCFSDFAIREVSGREHRFALKTWHKDPRCWSEILGPGRPFSGLTAVPEGIIDFEYYAGDLYPAELKANYIFTSTLMVRREQAGDALHFAEDTPTYEDWECFGRVTRAGIGAYLACETAWQHGHSGVRLTDADGLTCAQARLTIIERIWGSDEAFLAEHGEEYDQVLTEQRLIQAGGLIARGRTADARAVLRNIKNSPLSYRFLAGLPGLVVKAALAVRRTLFRKK